MKSATTARIVVEVDGTADELRVIDFATAEALRLGAELLLARPYRRGPAEHRASDVAGRQLREALAHVRRQVGFALPVRTVAREGSRPHVLAQLGRRADALVVARQRVRGPDRLHAAWADLRMAGRTDGPVVVVPRVWKPSGADRQVVVGVDGSALSREAVEYAFASADRRGGDLTVVHARNGSAWPDEAGLAVAETLAGWQQHFPGVAVRRVIGPGPIEQLLAREADAAGLLVLGTHPGPTAADPVAWRALAAATCPVALVRHLVPVQCRATTADLAGRR